MTVAASSGNGFLVAISITPVPIPAKTHQASDSQGKRRRWQRTAEEWYGAAGKQRKQQRRTRSETRSTIPRIFSWRSRDACVQSSRWPENLASSTSSSEKKAFLKKRLYGRNIVILPNGIVAVLLLQTAHEHNCAGMEVFFPASK
jgi:hypothetical protein